MRSCIGVRSCASSTIRWPCGAVGAVEQRARLVDEREVGVATSPCPRPDWSSALLLLVEDPVCGRSELVGLVSRRRTSCSGFGRGQSASSVRFRKPPVRSAASMSSNEW